MHNLHIGSLYRQKRQQHSQRPILRISVKGVSTMFSFASWVIILGLVADIHSRDIGSRWARVSNGSGLSLRVWVRVQTEPLPKWRSGLSIHPNCQLGYGSIAISQPVWIGWDVSGSHSGSMYKVILGSCCCSLIIVSYQNRIFNSQYCVFAWFAVCDIDHFGIHEFPLIYFLFAHQGGK